MRIDDIMNFCEGRIAPDKFYEILIHPDAEKLFENSSPIPPYTTSSGMLYYYLIEQNYQNYGTLLNVQDCLIQFMKEKNIPVNPTKKYKSLYGILLEALPAWLTIPQDYEDMLLQAFVEMDGTKAEKIKRLKAVLHEKFRSMKKPPQWLQDAPWPVVENEPLLFVGQMDITPLSHDTAQLFIFYDPRDRRFHTIAQSS